MEEKAWEDLLAESFQRDLGTLSMDRCMLKHVDGQGAQVLAAIEPHRQFLALAFMHDTLCAARLSAEDFSLGIDAIATQAERFGIDGFAERIRQENAIPKAVLLIEIRAS